MQRSRSERDALRKARVEHQKALLSSKHGVSFSNNKIDGTNESTPLPLPNNSVARPALAQDNEKLREIRKTLADDAENGAGSKQANPTKEPDIVLKPIKGFGKVPFAGYKDYTEDKEYRQRMSHANSKDEVDLGKRVLETVCRDLHSGSIGQHQIFSFTHDQDKFLQPDDTVDQIVQEEVDDGVQKRRTTTTTTVPLPVHRVPVIEDLRSGFDPLHDDDDDDSNHKVSKLQPLNTIEMDRVFGFTGSDSAVSQVRHYNKKKGGSQIPVPTISGSTWTAQRRHEYLDQLVRHMKSDQKKKAEAEAEAEDEAVAEAGVDTNVAGNHFWQRWMNKSVMGFLPIRLKRLVSQHQYVGGLVAKFQPMVHLGKQYMYSVLHPKAKGIPQAHWNSTVRLANLTNWLRCRGLYVRNIVEDEDGKCLGVKCALAPTETAKAIDPPNDIGILTDIRLALNYTAPVFKSKTIFNVNNKEAEHEERSRTVPLHLLNNRAMLYLESKLSNKIDLLSSDLEVTEESEDEDVCAFLEDCLFVKLLFHRVPKEHLTRAPNSVRAQEGERVTLVCYFFFILTEEFT